MSFGHRRTTALAKKLRQYSEPIVKHCEKEELAKSTKSAVEIVYDSYFAAGSPNNVLELDSGEGGFFIC